MSKTALKPEGMSGVGPYSIAIKSGGTVYLSGQDVDKWLRDAERWQALGATHISVQTISQGYANWQQHVDALQQFKENFDR